MACREETFFLVGNSKLTVDLAIWYQPVTVKLYFSLALMCSTTLHQCLQATSACSWCEIKWICYT